MRSVTGTKPVQVQIEITMPRREELVSNPMIGAAHGGALASLIDLTGLYTMQAQEASRKRRPICAWITIVLQSPARPLLTDRP